MQSHSSGDSRVELAELRAENQRLRAVLDAVARTHSHRDLEASLDAVLDAAADLLGADRCAVVIGNAGSPERTVRRARGLSEAYCQHLASGHLPLLQQLVESSWFSVRDATLPAEYPVAEPVRLLIAEEGFRGITGFALKHAGEPLGALVLYFDQPRQLSGFELELGRVLADRVALALVHARELALAEQLHQERETALRRLQAILDRIRDLVVVWNPEFQVEVANATAQDFLLAARRLGDCRPLGGLLSPDGDCPVQQVLREARSVVDCEVEVDDRVFSIDCHPVVDPQTGEVRAVVEHARDVTVSHRLQRELADKEAFMRLSLQRAPVGIAYLEQPDYTIIEANETLARLTDRPAAYWVGRPFLNLFALSDQPALEAAVLEALSRGQCNVDQAGLLQRNGELRPVSVVLGWFEVGEGRRIMQCIIKDVSLRLQVQAQLVEQEKLAAIGQLASGVAHELRNPVGIIVGALFDLEEILHSDDPDVIEDLTIAREEILRVQEVINNVLEFAHGGSAGREWVGIGALLQQTVTLLRKGMATRDVGVEMELGAVPDVWANRSAMRQVVLNLVTNSYQATRDGGSIHIRLWQADEQHVAFTVTDTGEGMTKDVLAHIFNPFFTTREPGAGAGLGLSIVYSAVREHGGQVLVESVPGVGSTFRVRLPIRAAETPRRERLLPLPASPDELF